MAYYKCNDGSGSTLTSSCTNTSGLDRTLQNGPLWVASPVQLAANAISFDGTNDAVTVPMITRLILPPRFPWKHGVMRQKIPEYKM